MKLVLLLALILPLQSFGAVWSCGSVGHAAASSHCPQHGTAPAGEVQQLHHCGGCCAAAIAVTPLRWTAPRAPGPAAFLPPAWPPPKIALERLDRPPRLV